MYENALMNSKFRFADKIKENVDLISQVELSVRGTLPKDTRKAVSLLIEYLHYYTCWVSKVPEFSSKAGTLYDDTI